MVGASQVALGVKSLLANAGHDTKDTDLILELRRPLELGVATHSSILAWRIPWTEEPGGPQSIVHKESGMTEVADHSAASSQNDIAITACSN